MSTPVTELRSAPHLARPVDVATIMRHVVGALAPLCVFAVYQFGLSALALIVTVTLACLATERLSNRLANADSTLSDWSAVITGILLALSLPAGFPLWMAAVAGVAAIALGKMLFGGIGCNVFNPALVGRAFVQAAFPVAISSWAPAFARQRFAEFIPSSIAWPLMQPPDSHAWIMASGVDALAGATPLARWKFENVQTALADLLSGAVTASTGETSAALLALACGGYLAARRFLDWRIPVAVLASAAIVAFAFQLYDPARYPNPLFVLLSGGLMLGAVFMASDMATSPVTPAGVWVYGALIGVVTVLIRYFGGLPEGVMYAILLGNAATPLIERYTQPRPFGARRRWRP